MYIHPVTRLMKNKFNKKTESMTYEEIKSAKKLHAKKRKIIKQQNQNKSPKHKETYDY